MKKVKEWVSGLSDTAAITKRELLLITAVGALGGMVIGMLCSPRKRTMIVSNNGNYCGSNNNYEDEIKEEEEAGQTAD